MQKRIKNLCRCGLLLIGVGCLALGCRKSEPTTAVSKSFDGAAVEVKAQWTTGNADFGRKDYLGAATNFMAVFDKVEQLMIDQSNGLTQVWLDLGTKAFEAANHGDARALKAVQEMRASGLGKGQGER